MATRIIWHGYLLTSTGSNLYTSNIARTWAAAGHTVVVMCQDTRLEQVPACMGHAIASERGIEWLSEPDPDAATEGGCILVNPDIAGLLPVYVLDRYEGFDVKRMVDLSVDERERYLHANRVAMSAVLDEWPAAEAVLVNHVVLGPAALRPALEAAGVPMIVKVHGSELEYAMAEDRSLREPAEYGLAGAARILAGSRHILHRTEELVDAEALGSRVSIVPPGVDTDRFDRARHGGTRAARCAELVAHLRAESSGSRGAAEGHNRAAWKAARGAGAGDELLPAMQKVAASYEEREIDQAAADSCERVLGEDPERPAVAYVGKLITQKGPQLALASFPLMRTARPDVRFAMAGFGPLREALGAFAHALSEGDLDTVRKLAGAGAALDGGSGAWGHVEALLAALERDGKLEAYLQSAAGIAEEIAWLGNVGHAELARLWSVVDVTLVPSIFPEAFGMVAAEAASAGALPVVAAHTGLGEVAAELERATGLVHGVSVDGDDAVAELAAATIRVLELDAAATATARAQARECVARLWSWDAIAEEALAGLTVGS